MPVVTWPPSLRGEVALMSDDAEDNYSDIDSKKAKKNKNKNIVEIKML